jgi:hypothetical protein
VSAAAGGWLYALSPRLPFWCQVPTAVAGLAAVVALRETPRPRSPAAPSHVRRALHLVRFTLWRHRRLQAAMALSVALGLASFVMVWLIQRVHTCSCAASRPDGSVRSGPALTCGWPACRS